MNLGIDPLPPPSVALGPSTSARVATWRSLLAIAQRGQATGKNIRDQLTALDRLGPAAASSILPPPAVALPTLTHVDVEGARLGRELQKHLDASLALERGQASAMPAGAFDLDIATAGNVSGLGVFPILAAIVVGGVAIVAGTYAYVKTLEEHQLQRVAALVEKGRDVSPILQAANPPPQTTRAIAGITTPIAIAAGVVGVAMLLQHHGKGRVKR